MDILTYNEFLERNGLKVSTDSYLAYLSYNDECHSYYCSLDDSFEKESNITVLPTQLVLF